MKIVYSTGKKAITKVQAVVIAIIILITIVAGVAYYYTTLTPTQQLQFKNGKRVMYLTPRIEETFWVACMEYLKRAVEADGWTFAFDSAGGSVSTQYDQVINYAPLYDLIILFPIDKDGVKEAVRIAQEQYHTPVIYVKNFAIGDGRFNIGFDDVRAGEMMAELAIEYLVNKYGNAEGRTIVYFTHTTGGWLLRKTGIEKVKAKHPEVNWVELPTGGTVAGWADAADAYFSVNTADVILSSSDGPYFKGVLDALERYGKLYYAEDPNHIYCITIDGKPSQYQWIRRGYADVALPQPIDAIMYATWELAKEYIVKDPSYQYPPYKMPEIPVPLVVKQPEGAFWGGENVTITLERGKVFPETNMPQAMTPVYTVNRHNVNDWRFWGNTYTFWKGKEPIQDVTWKAKGTKPAWSDQLLNEYETKFWAEFAGRH
ncbi:MAG: substrate-binding domain-containing protein [Candidatus Bathyarchaeia archaeon]